jgi:hypothetical protein
MKYVVAVLQGCTGSFALVRSVEGNFAASFAPARRELLGSAVHNLYGKLPLVYLAREANGYKFDAMPEIANDVGLALEDLEYKRVNWLQLLLQPAVPVEPAPTLAA